MFCRICGRQISEQAEFCPFCGTKVVVLSGMEISGEGEPAEQQLPAEQPETEQPYADQLYMESPDLEVSDLGQPEEGFPDTESPDPVTSDLGQPESKAIWASAPLTPNPRKRKPLGVLIGAAAAAAVLLFALVFLQNLPEQRIRRKLSLGQKYLEELKYEDAVLVFQDAIRIDGKTAEAYTGLGRAFSGLADPADASDTHYSEAERAYQKAIEIAPEESVNYYELADLYFTQADLGGTAYKSASDYQQQGRELYLSLQAVDPDAEVPAERMVVQEAMKEEAEEPAGEEDGRPDLPSFVQVSDSAGAEHSDGTFWTYSYDSESRQLTITAAGEGAGGSHGELYGLLSEEALMEDEVLISVMDTYSIDEYLIFFQNPDIKSGQIRSIEVADPSPQGEKTYEFDAENGRLMHILESQGGSEVMDYRFAYNETGMLTTIDAADLTYMGNAGFSISFFYNAQNRLNRYQIDRDAGEIYDTGLFVIERDSAGQLLGWTHEVDTFFSRASCERDEAGRIVRGEEQSEYAIEGTVQTDTESRTFRYDELGRTSEIYESRGLWIRMEWPAEETAEPQSAPDTKTVTYESVYADALSEAVKKEKEVTADSRYGQAGDEEILYSLYDLDHDGIKELFVYLMFGNNPEELYIYSYKNGEVFAVDPIECIYCSGLYEGNGDLYTSQDNGENWLCLSRISWRGGQHASMESIVELGGDPSEQELESLDNFLSNVTQIDECLSNDRSLLRDAGAIG